jgi:hypothetical protein
VSGVRCEGVPAEPRHAGDGLEPPLRSGFQPRLMPSVGQHFQNTMADKHKRNPALCRSSLLDGSQLALSFLNGAAYHLKRISAILDEAERVWWEAPDFEKGKLLTSHEINEVLWHLRSFFWELVGVFDLILQWANERFHLGVPEDKVA